MSQNSTEWKSVAWQQFLVARKELLEQYDQAMVYAKGQAVATHHGVVAEAAVRDWLDRFLPKRYGTTSGCIKSQDPQMKVTSHFDVIIYDQLEAPILWTETNRDKSVKGLIRVIPAEHVRAIIEIKSALSRRTLREAADKLGQLRPLMAGVNALNDNYPRYLPLNAILSMLFFELRTADAKDIEILDLVRDYEPQRRFHGPVILRGEGLDPNYTGVFTKLQSREPLQPIWAEKGLLQMFAGSGSKESSSDHILAHLTWGDTGFSGFAFDLLALLNGTYRPGFVSSFHGLDFSGV
jgi:hypothetical protein